MPAKERPLPGRDPYPEGSSLPNAVELSCQMRALYAFGMTTGRQAATPIGVLKRAGGEADGLHPFGRSAGIAANRSDLIAPVVDSLVRAVRQMRVCGSRAAPSHDGGVATHGRAGTRHEGSGPRPRATDDDPIACGRSCRRPWLLRMGLYASQRRERGPEGA